MKGITLYYLITAQSWNNLGLNTRPLPFDYNKKDGTEEDDKKDNNSKRAKADVVANFVGDYLFGEADEKITTDFLAELKKADRNLFQRFVEWVNSVLKRFVTLNAVDRDIIKLQQKFKRLAETTKRVDTQSGKSEGQYSLVEPFTDTNGNYYTNAVLLDTDFFDGLSPRNWGDKLKQYVENRAENKPFIMSIVDEKGNIQKLQFASTKDRVTKNGRSNNKVLDELSRTNDNLSKLSVIHIDEIASVSEENTPYYTEENNHQWLDENGWLHRNAYVIRKTDGTIFNLTFDIAKSRDGRIILFATKGKIKKVGSVAVNSLKKIKGTRQDSNFNPSIPNSSENVKTKLEERVTGDDLLNAQDLIEEIRTVGGEVDENGYVTVYHRTTENAKEKILSTGKMTAKEDGVFLSTKPNGQVEGYGSAIIKMSIPVEKLILDDIFNDEAHLRYPLKTSKATLNVSEYINNITTEDEGSYSLPDTPDIAKGKSNTELRALVDEGKITSDEAFAELSLQYGKMPTGENSKVDVTVPQKVSEKQGEALYKKRSNFW